MPDTAGFSKLLNADLPFIVTTDREHVDTETRKLIRSHVMRGKNRVKPRSKLGDTLSRGKPNTKSLTHKESIPTLDMSRALCSRFSGIPFAATVEPALVADVFSFATMFPMAMFLLHPCITSEHDETAQAWFTPMLFDAAYLHASCFTIQAYFDGFFGRTRSSAAQQRDRMYYAKCVGMLRERLALDDDLRLSDSTIMTVLALSGHAYTTGDYESVNNHCNGVLKIVSMRGVDTLFHNTRLLIEIVRCDLVMAIDKGSKPVLFAHNTIPWPLTASKDHVVARNESSSMEASNERNGPPSILNPNLATIWTAISTFCNTVNTATTQQGPKMTEMTFLHNMGSIMYRITNLHFEIGSIDEAFRFALLAFTSPLFLHWNRIELPDPGFNVAFRERLAMVDWFGSGITSQERLWLLTIAAASVAHEPDGLAGLIPLLREDVERCSVTTWKDMRDLLCSFLWVGLVYDKLGREIYDTISVAG